VTVCGHFSLDYSRPMPVNPRLMRFPAILLPLSFSVASVAYPADWPQWRGPERTGHVPTGVAVLAVLPADPKVAWHVKIGDGLASPVVSGSRVFYLDNQQGRETLHALDMVNANEFWHGDIDNVLEDGQSPPGPRTTPMVDGDRVYVQSCRGELRCMETADGRLLWQANYVTDFGAVVMGENGNSQGASRHGYSASPVVDGAALFALVGGKDGASVVAFEKRTGRVLWKSQNDEPAYAAPVIATIGGVKQLVAFTVDGAVGLALKDGGLLWRVPLKTSSGRHVTTPVVVNDMVLVASHEIGMAGI
jgi:outer membrane protein assembly factor BamB